MTAPRRRGLAGWVDVRGRRLGGWAFALNRATGLGVLVYLYLHLGVLSLLARGADAYDGFVELATHPVILFLDVVLLFGILVHGFNGIRIALVGMGLVVDRQRALFVAFMVIAALLLLVGGLRIFEETA
jgi:succinate dehydrogenase / fumarate reductase, cytochrome b subunit